MRAVDYHDKSPQSVCSPAGSEETTKSMLPKQKVMSLLWESSIIDHCIVCSLLKPVPDLISV